MSGSYCRLCLFEIHKVSPRTGTYTGEVLGVPETENLFQPENWALGKKFLFDTLWKINISTFFPSADPRQI